MTKPVVIVPGFGGSLLVNSKKPTKVLFKKEVIDNRWLNLHPYSPSYMMQWKEDMQCELVKDEHHRIIGYKNFNPDIQPYDLYGINGVQNLVGDFEVLNKAHQEAFENMFHYRYFYPLNEALLHKGYKPKKDLIGFPWDFRLLLDPLTRMRIFASLHEKITEVVFHQRKKATIVTHSLGGVFMKWFLEDYTDDAWIDQHIERLILANAPFGGTPSAVKAVLVGDYYVPFLNKLFVDELRINSAIVMGLPNTMSYSLEQIFWKTDKHAIEIQHYRKEQTISFKIWQDLYAPYIHRIQRSHSIPTTIFYSTGIETPSTFYSKSMHDAPHKVDFTDGDGMIPYASLLTAQKIFPNHTVHKLKHVGHSDIISHPLFISTILDSLR